MRLPHCAIGISFSMSFAMSCQRRESSLRSQAARANTSFILRETSLIYLVFQPSDPELDTRLSIAAWVKATGVTNVRAPIALDALHSVWPIASADGIICINIIHISPWEATVGLMKGAAAILPSKSPLYLYGPYKREGFETAPSNQAFDQNLSDRDPNWGLRDLEAVSAMAQSVGFSVPVVTEMSANNLSVVFRRM
jgi:hypothetical protein